MQNIHSWFNNVLARSFVIRLTFAELYRASKKNVYNYLPFYKTQYLESNRFEFRDKRGGIYNVIICIHAPLPIFIYEAIIFLDRHFETLNPFRFKIIDFNKKISSFLAGVILNAFCTRVQQSLRSLYIHWMCFVCWSVCHTHYPHKLQNLLFRTKWKMDDLCNRYIQPYVYRDTLNSTST